MKSAVIVLAAGGSTRLGAPKQLLVYEGRTLLRRAAETARAATDGLVVVVLGAGAEDARRELVGLEVAAVENPAWARGMGGSVRRGMEALGMATEVGGVLLTLCDQPLVGVGELRGILAAAHGEAEIVAAEYGGTAGVPAWFGRSYFEELRALPENAGAKILFLRHGEHVVRVALPGAAVDVDTREQFARLNAGLASQGANA